MDRTRTRRRLKLPRPPRGPDAAVGPVEAETLYRTLVEQIPAATYLWDVSRGVDDPRLWVSSRLRDILGFEPEDWMADANQWFEHVHPEDREACIAETTRTIGSGQPFNMEYRMLAADGRVVWVLDQAAAVGRDQRGRVLVHQGILLDITERKRAELEVERALETERAAAQRLRELDNLKNTFLQAVSHDLRTPLSVILGLALTLHSEDVVLSGDERKDLTSRLVSNARKLDRILSDLLDLDRLVRGVVEPKAEPVDVGDLVRRMVGDPDLLSGRTVRVNAESVMADVDVAKVERIVENLLVNAAKHTPSDTSIWVRVEARPEGVLIVVEDDGPGVEPEAREQIFEPFQQGGGDHPSPGSGIGLSLVWRFARLHGGRAWVEDRPEGGASFRVLLPFRQTPRETARAS